jgi:DGQHR domain-containing protein
MSPDAIHAPGILLQDDPRIYVAVLPGTWLLKRTTPSWRIDNPVKGFQRVVKEERAKEIAIAVLEQGRTFPNAIVLATDVQEFDLAGCEVHIPSRIKFLVVDGQHRLWSQHFSRFKAKFATVIHAGLSEVDMARLFLEINDTQRRVPSSLRWDLVRLVRPEDDPLAIASSEIILQLTTDDASPLYQRIDLTGEQSEIQLKQGSLAPEIKQLLKKPPLHQLSLDQQYSLLVQYLIAVRGLDRRRWGRADYIVYKARVLRALIRLLPDLLKVVDKDPTAVSNRDFRPLIAKIDITKLSSEEIRAAQGNAGIRAIYNQIRSQVLVT